MQCRPMAKIWNPQLPGTCFSSHITYLAGYIGFGLDAFTDLICAGIPVLILHRLHINSRTKFALCLLMSLGSLTAGCAIAKAITLKGVFASDYTFALTKPAICTIVEHLTSTTLVSLPALQPLFIKLLGLPSSLSLSKMSRRSYIRRRPIETQESSHVDTSCGDGDVEQADIPLRDAILKTTDFRVSSHNSDVRLADVWPLPPDSVRTSSTEKFQRSLGNSWATA